MFTKDGQGSGPGDCAGPDGKSGQPADGGKLLKLTDFEPVRPGHIVLSLRKYWDSLRDGRAIPYRSDVEPRGMRPALDYAFILERIAPGAARFRLAGRHLVELMGMEVRGMPFCSLLNPSSRGRLSDVLESVLRAPQIAELRLHAEAEYARPALQARILLLPLRSDLGDVTRILGCMVAEGEIGRTPRRFDMRSEDLAPVLTGGVILDPSASAAGFAEPPAPWRPPSLLPQDANDEDETPEERRARFRIIIDNS